MSLGSYTTPDSSRVAVDAVVNSGVTVVVSAGNRGTDSCLKSYTFIASAIGAGSSTSLSARSSFSNFGTCNAIFAPGSSVVSASSSSDTGTSTKSGTSMAAPHVAGAAAMLLEENPTLVAGEGVRSVLRERASAGVLTGLLTGDPNLLLNVGQPYTGPPTPPPPTPAPPPSGTFEVIAGTGCTTTGNCIQSNNHPSSYGNNEECTIFAWDVALTVDAFSTESGYDILTMAGTPYSGTSGPASGTYSGEISWSSDYSVVSSGWKLCRQGSSPGPVPTPAPSPTPAPTTPAPTTPAPTTPAPTTPAPSPPSGNCSSWCEPPADCVDYPYSCSGCCGGSPSPPSPPAPSPPSSGDCLSICDRCSDLDNYPNICGGCTDLC